MSNFSPTKCYDLSKYDVVFDNDGITIIEIGGKKVDVRLFADGFDVMVHSGDFCFGSITFDDSFSKTLDLNLPSAGVVFGKGPARVIGTTDVADPIVAAHIYAIDSCPVQMKSNDAGILTFQCPCDKQGTACTNACYSFGPWN